MKANLRESYHRGFHSSIPAPVDWDLILKFIPLINGDDFHRKTALRWALWNISDHNSLKPTEICMCTQWLLSKSSKHREMKNFYTESWHNRNGRGLMKVSSLFFVKVSVLLCMWHFFIKLWRPRATNLIIFMVYGIAGNR